METQTLSARFTGDWNFHDLKHMLYHQTAGRVEEALKNGCHDRDQIDTPEKLAARKAWVRARFLESIGGLCELASNPRVRTADVLREDRFRIEKLLIESRQDAFITANLYLPDRATQDNAPIPGILFLCGHSEDGKAYPNYQNVCQKLVSAGFAVLALDPIGQGERFEYYDPETASLKIPGITAEHDYVGKQCLLLGDSLARYFLADAMRGVDYLLSRPEIDKNRIGVTGNSGGGTQTSMLMLCDDRIAAAAPGTFLSSSKAIFRSGKAQDAEQVWPGLSKLGIDHEDFLLAMAPKPVMALSVAYDFFPMDGTAETVARAQRVYDMLGAPQSLSLFTDQAEHGYTDRLAKQAVSFFCRAFQVKEPEAPWGGSLLLKETLQCTSTGQLTEEIKNLKTVHLENLERTQALRVYRDALSPQKRKERGLEWLKAQVLEGREPSGFYPRLFERSQWGALSCMKGLFKTEDNRLAPFALFRPKGLDAQALPVTIAVWDNGTLAIGEHQDYLQKTCSEGRMILVIDPAGTGAASPHSICGASYNSRFGTLYTLSSELIRLGDSLCALRCFDVLRLLELAPALEGADGSPAALYGWGNSGFYALAAAALGNAHGAVQIENCRESLRDFTENQYYDWDAIPDFLMPGALSYFDMDDLKEWAEAH